MTRTCDASWLVFVLFSGGRGGHSLEPSLLGMVHSAMPFQDSASSDWSLDIA